MCLTKRYNLYNFLNWYILHVRTEIRTRFREKVALENNLKEGDTFEGRTGIWKANLRLQEIPKICFKFTTCLLSKLIS